MQCRFWYKEFRSTPFRKLLLWYLICSFQYLLIHYVSFRFAKYSKPTNSTFDGWFNRKLCMKNFLHWSSINILKSSIKIKFHTFCAQIASIFDGFVCGFRSFCCFDFFSLRSPLNWFIKQSKDGGFKRCSPTNRFCFQSTESRLYQEYSLFCLVCWAWHKGKKWSREVVSSRFCNASRTTDYKRVKEGTLVI